MTMSISLTASAADDERPPKWHNKTTIYRVTIQFNSGPSVEAYEHWGPSTPAEFEEKKFRYIKFTPAAGCRAKIRAERVGDREGGGPLRAE